MPELRMPSFEWSEEGWRDGNGQWRDWDLTEWTELHVLRMENYWFEKDRERLRLIKALRFLILCRMRNG